MTNLYNNLLKIALIFLLLLLYFLHFSFEQYEVCRFILISSFAWLAIIEKEPARKGWRFFFAVLVILFNPFYKLKIGLHTWKYIDLSVALLILINLISGFRFASLSQVATDMQQMSKRINRKKLLRYMIVFCIAGTLALIGWFAFHELKKIERKKEVAKWKITQDSLKRIAKTNDSIQEVRRIYQDKINDSIRTVKSLIVCTQQNAISNFKSYMKFYYPTWRMKDDFTIHAEGDCSYEISTLIKSTKYGGYGDYEALVVRVVFWPQDFYSKYSVSIIKRPVLFDE